MGDDNDNDNGQQDFGFEDPRLDASGARAARAAMDAAFKMGEAEKYLVSVVPPKRLEEIGVRPLRLLSFEKGSVMFLVATVGTTEVNARRGTSGYTVEKERHAELKTVADEVDSRGPRTLVYYFHAGHLALTHEAMQQGIERGKVRDGAEVGGGDGNYWHVPRHMGGSFAAMLKTPPPGLVGS